MEGQVGGVQCPRKWPLGRMPKGEGADLLRESRECRPVADKPGSAFRCVCVARAVLWALFCVLILWPTFKCSQISRHPLLWENMKVWHDVAGILHRYYSSLQMVQKWLPLSSRTGFLLSTPHLPSSLASPSFLEPVNSGLSTPSEATFNIIQ